MFKWLGFGSSQVQFPGSGLLYYIERILKVPDRIANRSHSYSKNADKEQSDLGGARWPSGTVSDSGEEVGGSIATSAVLCP